MTRKEIPFFSLLNAGCHMLKIAARNDHLKILLTIKFPNHSTSSTYVVDSLPGEQQHCQRTQQNPFEGCSAFKPFIPVRLLVGRHSGWNFVAFDSGGPDTGKGAHAGSSGSRGADDTVGIASVCSTPTPRAEGERAESIYITVWGSWSYWSTGKRSRPPLNR